MSAYFTIVASILGILQFFIGDPFLISTHFGDSSEIYATGFANFSSLFGLHLSMFSMIFWPLYVINYKGRGKLWSWAFFFALMVLILTFSRSAWLAVVMVGIILVWILWRRYPENRYKLLFSIFVSVLLVSATFATSIALTYGLLPDYLRDIESMTITERFSLSDESSTSRVLFHKAAVDFLDDDQTTFLIGLGVRGFNEKWPQYHYVNDEPAGPHSTFLEVLTAGGVISFMFFMLFLFKLYTKKYARTANSILVLVFLTAHVTALINGLFHTHLYTKYMWIILGVAISVFIIYDSDKINCES